jgi:hypothetical protein
MTTSRPILSRGANREIGYVDGNEAFDLSGKLSCRYDENTGNLCDLKTGKIVGHVSLDGKFIGASWIANELFPTLADNFAPLSNPSEESARPEPTEDTDSLDAHAERALRMVRIALGER